MCGRYYVDDDFDDRLLETLLRIGGTGYTAEAGASMHDVCPSMSACVLTADRDHRLIPARMEWGLPKYDGKGLVINARSETAAERPMFREGLRARRCVIPTSGFYEWNRRKDKVTFRREDGGLLFLAGLYNPVAIRPGQVVERFVILTTAANECMIDTHNRMPCVLEEAELRDWVMSPSKTPELMTKIQPQLHHSREYEQMTLF